MNKIFFVAMTFSFNLAFANPTAIGRITEVSGMGFISQNGSTHEIKKGELIYPNCEIVTEHSGKVSYTDNSDHRYHLTNSSSLAITSKGVELRSGDVWIQSQNRTDNFKLTTANASVEYQYGEAVVTYDNSKGKTQLMVISGMMKFSNYRVPDLNLSVSEGNFSFVDNAYDDGAPRDPTPAGVKTYNALIGEFKGVSPMDKNAEKIMASTSHEAVATADSHHEVKKEEATQHATEVKREIASEHKEVKKDDKLLEEYRNSMLEKKSHKTVSNSKKVVYSKASQKAEVKSSSPLVVQIFGLKKIDNNNNDSVATKSVATEVSARKPASVEAPSESVVDKKINTEVKEENKPQGTSKETEKLLEQIKNL